MMKISKPTTFMGEPIKGSLERFLARENSVEEPKKEPSQVNKNERDTNDYIFVPGINLYIAKERTLFGLNWNQTKEELRKQDLAMPTPYQFREFLKYLKSNYTNQEYRAIYEEITKVRNPWRAEWLNAKFEKSMLKRSLYIICEDYFENGKSSYQNLREKLNNFLSQDKTPGISLDHYLNSQEDHGLPPSNILQGNLYYWAPRNGTVARFFAVSGRSDLDCYRNASDAYADLGVRAVKGSVAQT